ncbi:Uma2 family endonuclease [Nonomuraea montanisoli]|uniref:Uma2 family endonuclease n=1 Tax=Nonomuraea montanisoli TaxID=2741721 RepID=UPI002E2CA660|nr:Uma2 family endonuclease [Nonomuraea montanisoli]
MAIENTPTPREHAHLVVSNDKPMPRSARELFEAFPELPGFRADVIEGNLIVSPVGTPEHARCAMRLFRALIPILDEKGWEAWAGNVDVCIEGPREPVEPDFVMAPLDCPRWGERELLSSGLIMVAEVVSAGSVVRDRKEKPALYAHGSVPIYLMIDTLAAPQSITVHHNIQHGAYRTTTTVNVGSPIMLPDPINLELDTSIFKG